MLKVGERHGGGGLSTAPACSSGRTPVSRWKGLGFHNTSVCQCHDILSVIHDRAHGLQVAPPMVATVRPRRGPHARCYSSVRDYSSVSFCVGRTGTERSNDKRVFKFNRRRIRRRLGRPARLLQFRALLQFRPFSSGRTGTERSRDKGVKLQPAAKPPSPL